MGNSSRKCEERLVFIPKNLMLLTATPRTTYFQPPNELLCTSGEPGKMARFGPFWLRFGVRARVRVGGWGWVG